MSQREATPLVVALIAGSHLVNHAYFTLLPPVFGSLNADLGISTAQSGLALGVVGAVVVVLQLPYGYLSDAHSRSLVLALSLVVGTVGAAMTALVTSFESLLLASAVTGVGIAGHHPAHYPMLSAATEPGARGRVFSVHGFAGALGFAVPFAVVGAATTLGLSWRVGLGAIAAVGALYAVGCLVLVARNVPRHITRAPGSGDRKRPALASLPRRAVAAARSLSGATAILLLTGLWFLTSMANWGIQAYASTLLSSGYGVATGTANVVVSAMLVVGAVAILAGGWLSDRYGSQAVILGGFAALVGMTATLATGALPAAAAIGLTLLVASTVKAGRPALSKLGDSLSAAEDLGKNFGILTIGISGGGAIGPPIFGALTDYAGIEAVFWAIAGLGVVSFAFTFVVLSAGERSVASGA